MAAPSTRATRPPRTPAGPPRASLAGVSSVRRFRRQLPSPRPVRVAATDATRRRRATPSRPTASVRHGATAPTPRPPSSVTRRMSPAGRRAARDRFITVYGRKPSSRPWPTTPSPSTRCSSPTTPAAPRSPGCCARRAERDVEVLRVPPQRVTKVSRNGRQDQGVVADIVAPSLRRLDDVTAAAPRRTGPRPRRRHQPPERRDDPPHRRRRRPRRDRPAPTRRPRPHPARRQGVGGCRPRGARPAHHDGRRGCGHVLQRRRLHDLRTGRRRRPLTVGPAARSRPGRRSSSAARRVGSGSTSTSVSASRWPDGSTPSTWPSPPGCCASRSSAGLSLDEVCAERHRRRGRRRRRQPPRRPAGAPRDHVGQGRVLAAGPVRLLHGARRRRAPGVLCDPRPPRRRPGRHDPRRDRPARRARLGRRAPGHRRKPVRVLHAGDPPAPRRPRTAGDARPGQGRHGAARPPLPLHRLADDHRGRDRALHERRSRPRRRCRTSRHRGPHRPARGHRRRRRRRRVRRGHGARRRPRRRARGRRWVGGRRVPDGGPACRRQGAGSPHDRAPPRTRSRSRPATGT